MRSRWLVILAFVLTMVASRSAALLAQQAAAPLTEREIIYLLGKKVSSKALGEMVQSYGVAFAAEESVFDRLRKAGATEALLETIRKKARTLELQIEVIRPEPPPPEPEVIPAAAQEHLQLGRQMLKAHDYQAALTEFAEAEKIRPKWDQVFKERGLVYEAMGQYPEAAAEWEQYLALAPADENKASIQQKIADWRSEASRVSQTRALLARGEQQLQAGDSKGAVRSFKEASSVSSSIGPLLALARVQLLDGDFAGLANTARQAQTLDPQSALAALYLADAEQRQDTFGSPALHRGVGFNPGLAYGRALLARELRKRATRAGALAETGGTADSTLAEERNRRGWVLWNGGYFQPALEELGKAAGLSPTADGWQCDLAYARLGQRDIGGASAAAREAIRLNPGSGCGHHALALSLERMGQHEKAAQEFQAAEKISSDLGVAGLLRTDTNPGRPTEGTN